MTSNNIGQQLENQWNDVLGRLATKQLFQSDWDIAAFAIFFTFIGLILLLILLVLIRCCCCCCCDCDSQVDKVTRVCACRLLPADRAVSSAKTQIAANEFLAHKETQDRQSSVLGGHIGLGLNTPEV
ncbi:unnamed protein product [Ranitomeya imitator]|uniref:Small integral membrane protein 22 n=1 Tax=Ranitomeya imitator TaxID=111125 RepID=A0ABN9LZ32_9NEOB|nr:unnamed protein product [Ranitomeya imitator]